MDLDCGSEVMMGLTCAVYSGMMISIVDRQEEIGLMVTTYIFEILIEVQSKNLFTLFFGTTTDDEEFTTRVPNYDGGLIWGDG